MRWLIDLPIRGKVLLITVLATAVALVLAAALMVMYDYLNYREQKLRDISVQADILAASVSASLVFSDAKAAQQYLNALQANADISAAGVYGADAKLFAGYTRSGAMAAPLPAHIEPTAAHVINSALEVTQMIRE